MSAASGWPGSSWSGRLLTIIVTPWDASAATSAGAICPPTRVLGSSSRCTGGLLLRGKRREHRRTIARKLGFAHALDARELVERARPSGGDLAQRRIVKYDVGWNAGLGGELPPSLAKPLEHRVDGPVMAVAAALAAGWRHGDG